MRFKVQHSVTLNHAYMAPLNCHVIAVTVPVTKHLSLEVPKGLAKRARKK